ncbi:anthranilate phosphoribosyltransferase [archaeon SCG-AAA382B04]|nr:anthranilate phosphoribosyltransferase [archaeon SCG-AAA382B04]
MIKTQIKRIIDKKDLSSETSKEVMDDIMKGKATSEEIASFITAMKMKGETHTELTQFAKIMRKHSTDFDTNKRQITDNCGTGGDDYNTFNISTTTSFVVSATSIPVAKHGNRGMSSKCGSADVLEQLGVNLDLSPNKAEELLEKIDLTFLYAPRFHPSMKNAIKPRKEVGVKTFFNLLGPLTNPAEPNTQVVGVYSPDLTKKIAKVLRELGLERAMVVHGDGLDEITSTGPTKISELVKGEINTYKLTPEDIGIKKTTIKDLEGGNPQYNAKALKKVLKNEAPAKKQSILANSAALIYLYGKSNSIKEGVEIAEKSIETGRALEKLNQLIKFSNAK